MWCGQAPDASALAACCVFTGVIVAWAVAALGALVLRTGDQAAMEDVLAIAFVACALFVAVHIAPPAIAALLATAVAVHALLIAAMLATDAQKQAPKPSA